MLKGAFGSSGGGSGTVTEITAGTGITLTPDPITDTGTVAVADSTGDTLAGFDAAGAFEARPNLSFDGNILGVGANDDAGLVVVRAETVDDLVFGTTNGGDSFYSFEVYADGDMYWGDGEGQGDTNLYRSAADTLKTDDAFEAASFNGVALTTEGSATDFLNAEGDYVAVGLGAPGFDAITSGTNTAAAMVVGSGASLAVDGTGTIAATSVANATLTTALTVNTGTLTLTANAANNSVLTIGAGAVSVSGANTGDQTSVSGNAGTATALETARTIGGASFDGTANIVPTTIVVADTTDSTCFVGLWESATGDLLPKTDAGITYDASNGQLNTTLAPTVNATGTLVNSDGTGVTGADKVSNIMSLTAAEYAAIGAPNASTLYIITDA